MFYMVNRQQQCAFLEATASDLHLAGPDTTKIRTGMIVPNSEFMCIPTAEVPRTPRIPNSHGPVVVESRWAIACGLTDLCGNWRENVAKFWRRIKCGHDFQAAGRYHLMTVKSI